MLVKVASSETNQDCRFSSALHLPKDPKLVVTSLALFCDNQGQTQFEFLYNKSVKGEFVNWDNKFGLYLSTSL